MKQLLLIAVALASVNANATRARVMALGNSAHLVDTQTVYNNPADIYSLPSDYLNFETGVTQGALGTTLEGANSEGMIVKSHGDSKFGLSLGHQSQNAASWGLRALASLAALKVNQQNPLELTYASKSGDMAWGATLAGSNYENKQAAALAVEKESSLGIRLGARASNWDASLRIGLNNVVQAKTGNKFTGTSAVALSGGYSTDSLYWFGGFQTVGAKEETTLGADVAKNTITTYNLGVLNSTKKDGTDLFYSVQVAQSERKETVADTKVTSLTLPVTIGVEHEANSWLTLRGSITQSTLINNSKTESAGTTTAELAPGLNTTTLALGTGIKLNKITFDGTLSTATTQTVNTTALLAQAGLSYWF